MALIAAQGGECCALSRVSHYEHGRHVSDANWPDHATPHYPFAASGSMCRGTPHGQVMRTSFWPSAGHSNSRPRIMLHW